MTILAASADTGVQRSPSRQELCYLAPYQEALAGYGRPVDELALFLVSSGPAFEYGYIHEGRQTPCPIGPGDWVSIVGHRPVDLAALGAFGLEVTVAPLADSVPDLLVASLAAAVIVVYADVFELDYHPLRGTVHGQAALLLHDYAPSTRTVGFIDSYVKTVQAERLVGRLPLDRLGLALASQAVQTRRLEICMAGSPAAALDMADAAKRFAFGFRRRSGPTEGPDGIRRLASDIAEWGEHWDESGLRNNWRMAHQHLTGRGGPVRTRRAAGALLRGYLEAFPRSVLIAKRFEQAAELWSAVAGGAFRASVRGAGAAAQSAQRLNLLADLEDEIAEDLDTWAQV